LTDGIASIMNFLKRISGNIQAFFRSNNIYILPIVDDLANKGDILHAVDGEIPLFNQIFS
jgi:hypothetical protein